MIQPAVLVTGIRVLDLICPIPLGGTLAIRGDPGSGVNVVAMETMQDLCRRYRARATCLVTAAEPFNESNVRGWVDKLSVGVCISTVVPGERAEISVANSDGLVATLLPFAQSGDLADGWVVLRRSVREAGRLPAVELSESSSRLADDEPIGLARHAKAEVASGNTKLAEYLSAVTAFLRR